MRMQKWTNEQERGALGKIEVDHSEQEEERSGSIDLL